MSRIDKSITRRSKRLSSAKPVMDAANQIPAGPLPQDDSATTTVTNLPAFRPPPIRIKPKSILPQEPSQEIPQPAPSVTSAAPSKSENLRWDMPSPTNARIHRSACFHEYMAWLNRTQDVAINNELTEATKELVSPDAEVEPEPIARTEEARPSVVFVESEAPAGYRRTFVDVDISQLQSPPLPNGQLRVDSPHQVQVDASETHLRFDESSIESLAELDKLAAPQLGHPESPYSSVTIDDQTANVVATISAAIASVIQERSEDELRTQAEDFLQTSARPIPPQEHSARTVQIDGNINRDRSGLTEISEDMLNDIIRQRMDQIHQAPGLGDLLQDRIDEHHSMTHQPETIPFAKEIESPIEYAAQPIATFASLELSQQASDQPMVVLTDSTEPSDTSIADENDVPLNLAAWDVEDFRWPVIANQMIVNGGNAIAGLLKAIIEQLPDVPRRVAISGVGRVQGTTSIATGIARWASAAGYRTLLVDADVACPTLSQRLGITSDISWLNGINNEMPPAELTIRSKKSNLCVMPLASSVTRVTWPRFIFDNLGEVLDSVKKSFDLILIDAGPASQLLDELSTPKHMLDSVVVVNDATNPTGLETIMTRLSTFGIDRFVMAENRVGEAKPNVA